MYYQARTAIFSEQTIKSSFRATGLVPYNPEYVLSQLIATPTPPSSSHSNDLPSSLWTSETPRTLRQLVQQTKLLGASILRSSQSPTEALSKAIRSCGQNLTRVTILERRVAELEDTVQHVNNKKRQSRRRLQTGGILRIGDAQDMIERADLLAQIARGGAQQPRQRAPPTCSNCHQIGHNRTTCPIIQDPTL
jgi:hypothetical protein